jgi:GDP-4-dehydro-6-deoxy-D-mannose reductase
VWGVARGGIANLPSLRDQVEAVDVDLSDPAAVDALVRDVQPDVVFHLAAQAHVPTSWNDPASTLITNISMQLNLGEALHAADLQPRIVVVSTGEVYGAVEPHNIPIDEDVPLRPVNPYAVSKAAQDLLAYQQHRAYNLPIVRVRPFNHTGARQADGYAPTAFAHQIARIEAGLQPPVVQVGNLDAQRDLSDVRDIVRGYLLAAEHGEAGAVYNLGSGRPVAMRTVLDTLLSLSTTSITLEPDPARMRPVDVPVIACDAGRFRARTGWQPEKTLEQTLHEVLNDWRQRVKHSNE